MSCCTGTLRAQARQSSSNSGAKARCRASQSLTKRLSDVTTPPWCRQALEYINADPDSIEDYTNRQSAGVRKLARRIKERLRDEIEPMLRRPSNKRQLRRGSRRWKDEVKALKAPRLLEEGKGKTLAHAFKVNDRVLIDPSSIHARRRQQHDNRVDLPEDMALVPLTTGSKSPSSSATGNLILQGVHTCAGGCHARQVAR